MDISSKSRLNMSDCSATENRLGVDYYLKRNKEYNRRQKCQYMEATLNLQQLEKTAKKSLRYSFLCASIATILYLDIYKRCFSYKFRWLHHTEKLSANLFVYGTILYLMYSLYTYQKLHRLRDKQDKRIISGFYDDNSDDELRRKQSTYGWLGKIWTKFLNFHFSYTCLRTRYCLLCNTVVYAQKVVEYLKYRWTDVFSTPRTPTKMIYHPYPDIFMHNSPRLYMSPYVTSYNHSPAYHRMGGMMYPQYFNEQFNLSTRSSNGSFRSPYNTSARNETIESEQDLKEYMNKSLNKKSDVHFQNRSVYNKEHSFWNSPSTNIFNTPLYQISPLRGTTSTINDDKMNMMLASSNLLNNISHDVLVQYVAKLKYWLSKTIVKRICTEIDFANQVFQEHGLTHVEIGNVGILRLRKIAEDRDFVNRYLPTLPLLYRFLNLCYKQSYLVQRIRSLAIGSYLADYNVDQKLSDQLPSDAGILFNLFCVYMDSQLIPLPQSSSARPFFSQYVILDDGKYSETDRINLVNNRAKCAILCSDILRPQLKFICDGKIQKCLADNKNIFYIIIQFLLYLRQYKDNMLEGVSLGPQGINISAVIEPDD